jgi:hypothetical protein
MLVVLLATWILVQAMGLPARASCGAEAALRGPDPLQPNQGCTVLYATDGELMLGGNNEDYFNPLTKVWFIPGEAGSSGRVYFGFDDFFPQGGMNDQGLFFDILALETEMPVSMEGKEYGGNLVDTAMAGCAEYCLWTQLPIENTLHSSDQIIPDPMQLMAATEV